MPKISLPTDLSDRRWKLLRRSDPQQTGAQTRESTVKPLEREREKREKNQDQWPKEPLVVHVQDDIRSSEGSVWSPKV